MSRTCHGMTTLAHEVHGGTMSRTSHGMIISAKEVHQGFLKSQASTEACPASHAANAASHACRLCASPACFRIFWVLFRGRKRPEALSARRHFTWPALAATTWSGQHCAGTKPRQQTCIHLKQRSGATSPRLPLVRMPGYARQCFAARTGLLSWRPNVLASVTASTFCWDVLGQRVHKRLSPPEF